eukprot:gb/GEZJ01009699.1/.p1 GENE.gb/GEZJ01009699.1/~~gb/GEZJ01009699.1/.p1  ORF type:complete len:183 (+),score=5.03 gb/GEZJ01009699.1/:167-715(+)
MMYLGSSVLPSASFMTAEMRQKLGNLRVKHLVDPNAMLKGIRALQQIIKYVRPVGVKGATLITLSDASHSTRDLAYGQSRIICRVQFITKVDDYPIFHPLYWSSTKQKRVTCSSFSRKTLACAEAEDRRFDMKITFTKLFPKVNITHRMLVDSKALFDNITNLHVCGEFRVPKTVTIIGDFF